MVRKYRYTTARQWDGDDGYQWAVWVKGEGRPRVCGLTRREVPYYRDRLEREQEELRSRVARKELDDYNRDGRPNG